LLLYGAITLQRLKYSLLEYGISFGVTALIIELYSLLFLQQHRHHLDSIARSALSHPGVVISMLA
jgi:hypothetical protein